MAKDLVILKIGGSVLTDKSKKMGVFRKSVAARIAKEIKEAKSKKDFDLILIHGAGAYPHYLTSKYQIHKGLINKKSAFGFVHVKKELFALNNLVWQEFLNVGLPVSTVQPSAVITTNNGEIEIFDTSFLVSLLRMGAIPMFCGDDTIDKKKGIAVLSGDKILAYLGRRLGANMLIFVSDVDGVFDKNPKVYKDAKILDEVNDQNFQSVIDNFQASKNYDVTGEMKGKLLAIKTGFWGMEVRIINGLRKDAVKDLLLGKKLGTRIYFGKESTRSRETVGSTVAKG